MSKKMTWREAVLALLREKNGPVHYGELADEILGRKLVETETATPANTVYAVCLNEIRRPNPEVVRLGKGFFGLTHSGGAEPQAPEADDPAQGSWIQSLGVLWRRDWVRWTRNPKLMGIAPNGVKNIDFADQRGVYILYGDTRPVYVGRSIDRPMGTRLSEHVTDRLGSRWDRFSWFGLRAVTEAGALAALPTRRSGFETFIADLEAILIEALETPLNRRRGDDLETKEYRQVRDETQHKQNLKRTLEAILRGETE